MWGAWLISRVARKTQLVMRVSSQGLVYAIGKGREKSD